MTIKTLLALDQPVLVRRPACGCVGRLRPEGCRGGQYPVASMRIVEPCKKGHPHHVAAGVTERFLPEEVELAPEVELASVVE